MPLISLGDELSVSAEDEFRRHADKVKQKEKQLDRLAIQLDSGKDDKLSDALPIDEKPCFKIGIVSLDVPESLNKHFASALERVKKGAQSPINKCLGIKGIQYTQESFQNELIKEGFITTKVVIKDQDLSSGELVFTIKPGRLNNTFLSENSDYVNLFSGMSSHSGSLLNLRDIETSLENLRFPASASANISILPSEKIQNLNTDDFGYSDLEVKYKKKLPVYIMAELDDSGSKRTGQYQSSISVNWDAPLRLSDVLLMNYGHSVDTWNNTGLGAGNDSIYINYIVPFRKWRFSASYNEYSFYEILLGLNKNLKYRGESDYAKLEASRLLYRSNKRRLNAYANGYLKTSKKYIEDLEILVQRRVSSGWQVGIKYEDYLEKGHLFVNVNYKRGTNAFGAKDSPESKVKLAKDVPSILSLGLTYQRPLELFNQSFGLKFNARSQLAEGKQIAQDAFGIGGRYSVRGFGEGGLSGDRGVLLQNELSWFIPNSKHKLYSTFDSGWVFNDTNSGFDSNKLLGTTIGLKLDLKYTHLDLFWGRGISAPNGIKKNSNAGFRLTFHYR